MSQGNGFIGSRQNPYDQETYERLSSGSWNGGWVEISDDLIYITHDGLQYSGKGEHNTPYPIAVYDDMCVNHFWLGGWVQVNLVDVEYVTQGGTHYTETEGLLGRQENPCPVAVFEEMCSNGIWNGGWIIYPDGSLYNMYNLDLQSSSSSCGSGCGCGCGCGCGSGCGCGCGSEMTNPSTPHWNDGSVTSGCGIIATLDQTGKVVLNWSSGNTVIVPLSNLTVSVNFPSYTDYRYRIISNGCYGRWCDQYTALVRGSITFGKKKKGQPDSSELYYSINLEIYFNIPYSYRVTMPDD